MKVDEIDCLAKLDRDGCAFYASWTIARRTPTQDRAAAVAYIYAKLGQRHGRKGGQLFVANDLSIAQLNLLLVELVGHVPQDEPRRFIRRKHGPEPEGDIASDGQLIHDLIEQPDPVAWQNQIAASIRLTVEED